MELRRVPVELAQPLWPAVGDYIEKACEHALGAHTKDSTFFRVTSGACQMWIGFEDRLPVLVCTASALQLPDGSRAMVFELVGGPEAKALFAMKDEMEQWAREQGCSVALFYCPKSWAKLMPDYDLVRYLMAKTL